MSLVKGSRQSVQEWTTSHHIPDRIFDRIFLIGLRVKMLRNHLAPQEEWRLN